MVNVRKSITKKTLASTKAMADVVEKNLKDQAEAGKVVKPETKKKATKPVAKKIAVKGKSTKQIKQQINEQSTVTPLGGMKGEALIKHHQSRVEFLRKHPEDNKSIHPVESWRNRRRRLGMSIPQRKVA